MTANIIACFCGLLVAAGASAVAETPAPRTRPTRPETGPTWIHNPVVRIELSCNPSVGAWQLVCSRWDEAGGQWRLAFQGKLAGLMRDDARMRRHREQWKGYYVFDGVVPTDVRTSLVGGSATLDCRLTRGDAWMDYRAQILSDTGYVYFTSPRQSDPGLIGHCSQAFADAMTYLVVDVAGSEAGVREVSARECRGQHVTVQSQQYVAAYRPGVSAAYFILWPGRENRRVMFSPGGFQTAWLDCPYLLYAGEFGTRLDAAAARHLATALQLRAVNLLPAQGGSQ